MFSKLVIINFEVIYNSILFYFILFYFILLASPGSSRDTATA